MEYPPLTARQKVVVGRDAASLEEEIAVIQRLADEDRGDADVSAIDAVVVQKKQELARMKELLAR
jgi:hypothetical protein